MPVLSREQQLTFHSKQTLLNYTPSQRPRAPLGAMPVVALPNVRGRSGKGLMKMLLIIFEGSVSQEFVAPTLEVFLRFELMGLSPERLMN